MQRGAGSETGAAGVSGVPVDFRMHEDDVDGHVGDYAGSVKRKVVPSPTALVTAIVPPWASMTPFDDGQAQADAAMRAAIHVPVTLKDDGQFRRGNSTAGVRDRESRRRRRRGAP
jgi:hypothetical protein